MSSARNRGVIDLRKGRRDTGPSEWQERLFSVPEPRRPQTPKRPLPLRARRRRARFAYALGILLLSAGLAYGVSWVSYLPQFNISSITVSGAQDISSELISRTVEVVLDDGAYHFLSRRNVLLYPRTAVEAKIVSSFPPIKSAHVTRVSFRSTSLAVSVEERQPFAKWCTDTAGECFFMDDGGYIYTVVNAAQNPQTPYLFSGSIASSTAPTGQYFQKAHLAGMLALFRVLGQAGFMVQGAHVDNGQDFFVRLESGWSIKVSYGSDVSTLAKNLQLVLASDVLQGKQDLLEYVDLRFGDRVYYKLKGEPQKSAQ